MTISASSARRGALSSLALLLLFVVLAVALESGFHVHVRLPGHRAFPGALTLVLFAELAAPVFLLALATTVPVVLTLLGQTSLLSLIPWLGLALTLIALQDSRWRRHIVVLLCAGLLFGLLRFVALSFGAHRTPQIIRLGGHLFFGGIGGVLAGTTIWLHGRKDH